MCVCVRVVPLDLIPFSQTPLKLLVRRRGFLSFSSFRRLQISDLQVNLFSFSANSHSNALVQLNRLLVGRS